MTQRLFVGTRKGLFTLERNGNGRASAWAVTGTGFLGDPVTAVLPDGRDGAVYAALRHGHFGAKLHRSRDGGAGWQECAAPAYPEQPAGQQDLDPGRKTPIP